MDKIIIIHLLYFIVSIAMTIWVAKTLHNNGRVFLLDAFNGNASYADAVNHLLVVGFYLINIGFILLFLKFGTKPIHAVGAIEYAATKLGVVMLVLGGMHFFNMFNFNKMRKKGAHKVHPPELKHT